MIILSIYVQTLPKTRARSIQHIPCALYLHFVNLHRDNIDETCMYMPSFTFTLFIECSVHEQKAHG